MRSCTNRAAISEDLANFRSLMFQCRAGDQRRGPNRAVTLAMARDFAPRDFRLKTIGQEDGCFLGSRSPESLSILFLTPTIDDELACLNSSRSKRSEFDFRVHDPVHLDRHSIELQRGIFGTI